LEWTSYSNDSQRKRHLVMANGKLKKIADSKVQPYDMKIEEVKVDLE